MRGEGGGRGGGIGLDSSSSPHGIPSRAALAALGKVLKAFSPSCNPAAAWPHMPAVDAGGAVREQPVLTLLAPLTDSGPAFSRLLSQFMLA